MKKRLTRNCFNMVEIMLAVIVIALGIAGTFVLFPVGLEANKAATAENSIADIAEYIAAFVQAEVVCQSVDTGNNKGFAFKESNDVFCAKTADVSEAFEVDNVTFKSDENSTGKTLVSKGGMPLGESLYKHDNGIYVYRQLSGPEGNQYVDFSAVAKVYLDTTTANESGYGNEYFYDHKSEDDGGGGGFTLYSEIKGNDQHHIGKFLLPVIIEISWPATVPASDREKRYFRFEIFNDQYDVANDADAQKSSGS